MAVSRPRGASPKKRASTSSQHRRILIGGAAQHHAIEMGQMRFGFLQSLDAAIEHDVQMRIFPLHPIDQIIIQRRHVAVFLGRKALQPGLARMHGETGDAGIGAGARSGAQRHLRVLVVHADAAFDGDGNANGLAHCRHAIGHQRGSRIRQAPKRPDCTRSDGQPTLRLISS